MSTALRTRNDVILRLDRTNGNNYCVTLICNILFKVLYSVREENILGFVIKRGLMWIQDNVISVVCAIVKAS